jgi:peptidoglycan/xylan/chitin deacetylase (PgdA/CDA1 family)
LEDLDVPFCIFVNGCTLEGKTLWRDKIRYLINHGLADEFLAQAKHTQPVGDKTFYRYSKEAPNNSRIVEQELDAFLDARGVALRAADYYLSNAEDFRRHPLVSYGNHTHDHYVLTTLTDEQQYDQIAKTHAALAHVEGINRSQVLSIPFGKPRHFDHQTAIVAREFGYRCLLMSRNQIPPRLRHNDDLPLIERFMPDERPISQIFTEILGRNAA